MLNSSDGSWSNFFDLGQVYFLWLGSGWVSHRWFGFGFGKFPKKTIKFFNIFHFGSKKISLGRVKKYPSQRQAGLLIFSSSKVSSDWVGLGQGPSLLNFFKNIFKYALRHCRHC